MNKLKREEVAKNEALEWDGSTLVSGRKLLKNEVTEGEEKTQDGFEQAQTSEEASRQTGRSLFANNFETFQEFRGICSLTEP